jgi:hypothetical protein
MRAHSRFRVSPIAPLDCSKDRAVLMVDPTQLQIISEGNEPQA